MLGGLRAAFFLPFNSLPRFHFPPRLILWEQRAAAAAREEKEAENMENRMELKLADGFRVVESTEKGSIGTLGEKMATKCRRRYTSGLRRGDRAILLRHEILCPRCGRKVPAYGEPAVCAVTRDEVARWAAPGGDGEERWIFFNQPLIPEEYACPFCGETSAPMEGESRVTVGWDGEGVTLSCEKADIRNLFSLPMAVEDGWVRLALPLTETVRFDLNRGEVTLEVRGQDGVTLAGAPVTPGSSHWEHSWARALLAGSRVLRRKLLRAFALPYGGTPPFEDWACGPEDFLRMTRFRGYPRRFFDTVPYDPDTGDVERSFSFAADRLHSAADLPGVYAASRLPQIKSVKRIFFSEPGLFFYLEEAEALWRAVGDPNQFRRLLELRRVYELLSFLHRYPGTEAFFRDYREERGMNGLLHALRTAWRDTKHAALGYAAMDPALREAERRTWKRGLDERPEELYSLPMPVGEGIRDCVIDGYSFLWLRTEQACREAGDALENCLIAWDPSCSPVVAVKRGSEYRAAIEVKGRSVVQAKARRNTSMERDPDLNRAFRKWLKRFTLELLPQLDFDGFDEPEDLPF